jgi:hypothetical protein
LPILSQIYAQWREHKLCSKPGHLFVIDKPKRADTEAYWASSVIGREGEMPVIRELPIVERLKKS